MAKGVGTLLEKWQLFQVISFSFLLLNSLISITTEIATQRVVSFSILPPSEKCTEPARQCLPFFTNRRTPMGWSVIHRKAKSHILLQNILLLSEHSKALGKILNVNVKLCLEYRSLVGNGCQQ